MKRREGEEEEEKKKRRRRKGNSGMDFYGFLHCTCSCSRVLLGTYPNPRFLEVALSKTLDLV